MCPNQRNRNSMITLVGSKEKKTLNNIPTKYRKTPFKYFKEFKDNLFNANSMLMYPENRHLYMCF